MAQKRNAFSAPRDPAPRYLLAAVAVMVARVMALIIMVLVMRMVVVMVLTTLVVVVLMMAAVGMVRGDDADGATRKLSRVSVVMVVVLMPLARRCVRFMSGDDYVGACDDADENKERW